MKKDQIRIKTIKLGDLNDFAGDICADPSYEKVAPISLMRAASQSNNPYGRPEDVVLYVAFSGNQCVGYHGLLPAVFSHGDHLDSVYWATTFYVAPEYRGRGIGKCLLEEIKNARVDFFVTQMTESAERTYKSAGYQDIGALDYFQLRVDRLDFPARFFDAFTRLFRKKSPDPKGLSASLKQALYRLIKKTFYRIALNKSHHHPHRFSWKVVDQINESLWGDLNRHPNEPGFFRGAAAVNWMLKYPWVVSRSDKRTDMPNYYFSGVREIFQYVAVEISSPGGRTPRGFLVLSISHKKEKTRVKVLDFHFNDPANCEIAAYLALKYAKAFLADRIEYPGSLKIYFKKTFGFKKLTKKQSRTYIFYPGKRPSPLAKHKDGIVFNFCDGDTAFT
ncbi:MAG: GNAT family N-acetyltransferase [Desulfobacterales bacterium]